MKHAAVRAQELNPGRLPSLYRKEFELSKVRAGETIAVVSDLSTRRDYVAARVELILRALKTNGKAAGKRSLKKVCQ